MIYISILLFNVLIIETSKERKKRKKREKKEKKHSKRQEKRLKKMEPSSILPKAEVTVVAGPKVQHIDRINRDESKASGLASNNSWRGRMEPGGPTRLARRTFDKPSGNGNDTDRNITSSFGGMSRPR